MKAFLGLALGSLALLTLRGTAIPARPGYLQSYRDPDSHATVTRITDSTTDVSGSTRLSFGVRWGNTVRNHYRSIQPWNADESLILLQNESFDAEGNALVGPEPKRVLLDGSTYAFKSGLLFEFFDSRWHPTDPRILIYTSRNRLLRYDAVTHVSSVIHVFERYPATNGSISLNNTNLSADGRFLVIAARIGPDVDFILYDLDAPANRDGTVSTGRFPRSKIDVRTGIAYSSPPHPWATLSPSGRYIVMFWDDAFSEIYDRSFHLLRVLSPSGVSHYDLAEVGGRDYVVGVHKNPGAHGYVYECPLDGGASTQLTTEGFAADTSARNRGYPGWAFVTYGANQKGSPFSDEITAVDLSSTSSRTTRRIAHCFNFKVDYVSEVHAVPSPDGLRVLFQSNWGNRGGNGRGTDTYVADLRPLILHDRPALVQTMSRIADRLIGAAPLAPGNMRRGDWTVVKRAVFPKTAYWSYPTGVSLRALQGVSDITHDRKLLDYVAENNALSAQADAFLRWQQTQFGTVSGNGGLGKLRRLSMLDDCGAMGAEILESNLRHGVRLDAVLSDLVAIIGHYVTQVQSRLPDRTFWRPESPDGPSIWADDLYMSVPFLVRWSEFRHDPAALDDAATQVINFASYLQDDDGILFHAYLVKERRPNGFKWGRANGWAAVAMSDLLTALPTDHPKFAPVLKIYRKLMNGLGNRQSASGLWPQVIDHPELSWGDETSCSAEFLYAMARGLRRGWLDESYREPVRKALAGLLGQIGPDGTIHGVCKSTSIGRSLAYYNTRPKVDNDAHGFGTVLLALTEAWSLDGGSD